MLKSIILGDNGTPQPATVTPTSDTTPDETVNGRGYIRVCPYGECLG